MRPSGWIQSSRYGLDRATAMRPSGATAHASCGLSGTGRALTWRSLAPPEVDTLTAASFTVATESMAPVFRSQRMTGAESGKAPPGEPPPRLWKYTRPCPSTPRGSTNSIAPGRGPGSPRLIGVVGPKRRSGPNTVSRPLPRSTNNVESPGNGNTSSGCRYSAGP